MGSGSSAGRRSGEQPRTGGAPRSRRSPSPDSSSSDSCRRDVWQQGDPSPAATLPFADPTQEDEDDDTDEELEKALVESQDVYCPQEPGRGSPPPWAGTPAPGSSPLHIPSLELQGTPASSAQGWALQDRALSLAGWPPQDTPGGTSTELLRGCTQDFENNKMPNKFQSKSDVISDTQDPILYDMSEEELMASIEREY